jgi:hypothetical protein
MTEQVRESPFKGRNLPPGCAGFGDCDCDTCFPPERLSVTQSHAPRWLARRSLWAERWRIGARFSVYHGFGSPRFEFEFRFGFPKRQKQPEWLIYEDSDAE